jgi:hypothetical protein
VHRVPVDGYWRGLGSAGNAKTQHLRATQNGNPS